MCIGCVQKAVERDEWEEKWKQEVQQRKELKKLYLNLSVRFSEVTIKYDDLLKATIEKDNNRVVIDEGASDSADVFTQNEIKFLQCMPLDKKNDCSFILHSLKY